MGVASSGGLPHTPGVRLSFEGDYLSRATIYCVITVYTLGRKNTRPFADFSYKTAIFKRLGKYLKLSQKSSFIHHLPLLMGDACQKVLVPKFSLAQILRSVKLENAKKRPFY